MRILYLKLKNYAGIYAGFNKYEIEIDFKNNKNDIVMLYGGNGSGKTTILSALQPFSSSTNDERSNVIIEGKEGYKEIHILHDNVVYIIKHYYKKQNKSYIGKVDYSDYLTGSYITNELNENGGVKTFKEIVENELNVTEDLFKLSRIGSNVTNLMDLSTADRKLFISNFLPNIDQYLEYYKVINEKYKVYNKEIKFVSDEILKLDKRDNLVLNQENYARLLKELNDDIDDIKSHMYDCKHIIESLDPDEKLKNARWENPYTEAKNKSEDNLNKIKNSIHDIDKMMNTDYNSIIITLKANDTNFNSKLNNIKENENSLYSKIESLRSKIESLAIDNTQNYEELIKEKNNGIKELENELKELNITDNDKQLTLEQLYQVNANINNIVSCIEEIYKANNIKGLIEYNANYVVYNEKYNSFINSEKSYVEKLADINSKIKFLNNNKDSELEKLSLRPNKCNIDNCPFIQSALEYTDIDDKLDNLNKEKLECEKWILKFQENKTILEDIFNTYKNTKKIYEANIEQIKILSLYDGISSFDKFLKFIKNNSITTYIDKLSIADIVKYVNFNSVIIDYKNKIELLQSKLDNYNNQHEYYEQLINEVNEAEINLRKCKEEKSTLQQEITSNQIELENITNDSKIKEKYITALDEFNINNKLYTDNIEVTDKVRTACFELINLKTKMTTKTEEKEILEEKNKNNEYKLLRLNEYEERKKKLEEEFETINLIRDSLNPTKGLPVHFINNYLDKTKEITNELLELSQNNKFLIDFEIDEKNFFIKVYKNDGTILNDISQASQGEVSLTSLSLSLALLEQSMTKYNILYLDELDGALDTQNRKAFIDMVSTQMKKLNMEQVFIISHNNEFDYYPVDLILLKNNNFDTSNNEIMNNKNVIFKY
jgi:DNA repair exonuclease SbcCD ATPase subunit